MGFLSLHSGNDFPRMACERGILTFEDHHLPLDSLRYCCGLKQGGECEQAKETVGLCPSSCVLEAGRT